MHTGHGSWTWIPNVAQLGRSSCKIKMKWGIILLKEGKGLERISRME